MYLKPEGDEEGNYDIPESVGLTSNSSSYLGKQEEQPSGPVALPVNSNNPLHGGSPPAYVTRLGLEVRKPKHYGIPG